MMDRIKAKGFSLIEFMVALVIAVLFGIITIILLNSSTRQASTIKDVADVAKNSRNSLFLLARDIANVGYMLNCVGRNCASILVTPTAQAITYTGYTTGAFSTGTTAPAPLAYASSTLTLNYAALAATDIIQVKYSIANNALVRTQIPANITTTAALTGDIVASNIIQMALQFGLDSGTCTANSGTVSYSSSFVSTDACKLRSIKVALLSRSELPDKKYVSPTTIPWVDTTWQGGVTGAIYTVPTSPDQSHYRFKVMQQEVYLLNPTLTIE